MFGLDGKDNIEEEPVFVGIPVGSGFERVSGTVNVTPLPFGV